MLRLGEGQACGLHARTPGVGSARTKFETEISRLNAAGPHAMRMHAGRTGGVERVSTCKDRPTSCEPDRLGNK